MQPLAANQARPAEPALSCRTVHWKVGDIIRLQAQPYKQVHVALPETGIDVIIGDKELWALDWIGNRIFIKPTSRASDGRSTTITAVGKSGSAYEFLVTRVEDNAEIAHCVYITVDGPLITRANWNKSSENDDNAAALEREVASLREQNAAVERQAREDMKAYRKKIYTGYEWKTGVFSRWSSGDVEAVYDDGRFTFVRMKQDGQGLASIMAVIDGKPQMLEYSYDSPSRTFQISGIFPKFTLRAGEQSLEIQRKVD